MRFCGGGVGHPQFHEYLWHFEKDTCLDVQVLPHYDVNGEEITPFSNGKDDPGIKHTLAVYNKNTSPVLNQILQVQAEGCGNRGSS